MAFTVITANTANTIKAANTANAANTASAANTSNTANTVITVNTAITANAAITANTVNSVQSHGVFCPARALFFLDKVVEIGGEGRLSTGPTLSSCNANALKW